MKRAASVCPKCGHDSEPWVFHEGKWWVKRSDGDYYLDEARNEWVQWRAPGDYPIRDQ
jgi:hypothetical protein